MKGEHFHEEFAFKVIFRCKGKVVRESLFKTHNCEPFLTLEDAERAQAESMENFGAYIAVHGSEEGINFDSVETFSPVRRIVTEWEVA